MRPDWFSALVARAAEAPGERYSRLPVPADGGRRSAVLVLFGPSPDVLVLERASSLRDHAGQPAFPGGGQDPEDADAVACALREANEEVGLDPASVDVALTLPDLWIPVSGYVVTPVLAWWHTPHPVRPMNSGEVARVERLPVADLVDPANRLRVRHPSGWTGPAFRARDMLVWGFTAGVLSVVLDLGGWTVPWDTAPVEDLPADVLALARRVPSTGDGASEPA